MTRRRRKLLALPLMLAIIALCLAGEGYFGESFPGIGIAAGLGYVLGGWVYDGE